MIRLLLIIALLTTPAYAQMDYNDNYPSYNPDNYTPSGVNPNPYYGQPNGITPNPAPLDSYGTPTYEMTIPSQPSAPAGMDGYGTPGSYNYPSYSYR